MSKAPMQLDIEGKPVLNQYYPGGAAQQALDWNLQQHEVIAGGEASAGPTGPAGPAGADGADGAVGAVGPTGPTGPAPPLIINYGAVVTSTAGVTVTFATPYVNAPPSVATGMDSTTGAIQVTSVTLVDVTIRSTSGSPTVYWQAMGT